MCPGLGLVLLLKAFGWQSIRINIKEPPCISCDCCLSTAATMMRVKAYIELYQVLSCEESPDDNVI
jgi:hypothetical protein